jgi:hypothetical protein
VLENIAQSHGLLNPAPDFTSSDWTCETFNVKVMVSVGIYQVNSHFTPNLQHWPRVKVKMLALGGKAEGTPAGQADIIFNHAWDSNLTDKS